MTVHSSSRCAAHFGQTAEVKEALPCSILRLGRDIVSAEITVKGMPCSNLRLESSP